MSHDQVIKNLKEKTASQEEEIRCLKNKKDEVQTQYNNLKRWLDDTKYKEKQMYNELLADNDELSKKLTKAETAERDLRNEKKRLTETNDRITEQLNILKQNENKILSENTNLKKSLKCAQSELQKFKKLVEENRYDIDNLCNKLKCKEDENCNMRRQLDEFKTECDQLNSSCDNLKSELECTKAELSNVKSNAMLMNEKMRLERETLCNDLEVTRKQLCHTEMENDKNRQRYEEEKSVVLKLNQLVESLRVASDRDRCEFDSQIQKLNEEKCMTDETLSCMTVEVRELTCENECITSENERLKAQLRENENQFEKMKNTVDCLNLASMCKLKELERDKNMYECDVQEKYKKICDLEREVCRLSDEIKECEVECCRREKIARDCEKDKCQREICMLNETNESLRNCLKELEAECCRREKVKECELNKCLEERAKEQEEIKCLRDKIKEKGACCGLESNSCRRATNKGCGSKNNTCCPPSSCDTCPTISSKNMETRNDCCNSDNSGDKSCLIDELKVLYCDIEQLEGSVLKKGMMNAC